MERNSDDDDQHSHQSSSQASGAASHAGDSDSEAESEGLDADSQPPPTSRRKVNSPDRDTSLSLSQPEPLAFRIPRSMPPPPQVTKVTSSAISGSSASVHAVESASSTDTSKRRRESSRNREASAESELKRARRDVSGESDRSSAHRSRRSSPASPFRYPDCQDKLRSPRRSSHSRQLFSTSDEDEEKESSMSAAQDPLEAPIRQILPLIARWSEASLGPPHDHQEATHFRLESEGQDPFVPAFLTLSTASGIVKAVRAREAEFRQRDLVAGKAIVFSKPFTSSRMRTSKCLYKGNDDAISLEPLAPTPNAPEWLRVNKPEDRLELRYRDIVYWETRARTALRILNMSELINQALRRGSFSSSDPKFADLCATNVKCTKDLLKIVTAWLSNSVQLRRDCVLQRLPLSLDQLFELRHADYVSERHLFPEQMVKEVDLKFRHDLQNRALQERYAGPARHSYSGGSQRHKSRTTKSGNGGHSSSKRDHQPRHSTPLSPPAAKPAQQQQQQRVFPKAAAPDKHR